MSTQKNDVESADVADHQKERLETHAGLVYPHGDAVPEGASVIEVAKGVLWARIPLPWSLDHINVYLFDEGDHWALVDTGSNGKRGIAAWEAIEAEVLGDKPLKRIIATHMHPDHLGLAGWLVERHGASFEMTMSEYLMASALWLGGYEPISDWDVEYLFRMGVSRQFEPMIRGAGNDNFKKGVAALPRAYKRLQEGMLITLGGRRWQVVIGRGHSPEHACLYCLDEPLFISGDQVLANITSNVSVYPREPEGNPLALWLTSLDRMKGLPGNPLVLPSHGRVFYGLTARLGELIDSHMGKLDRLMAGMDGSVKAVEILPLLFRRQLTGVDFFMALGEAVAHLNLMVEAGFIKRSFDGRHNRYEVVKPFDPAALNDWMVAEPGVALPPLLVETGA
ncbi:MBL fold metallo-hydrolase [Gimibacter soli]|uniref:MBL fold metallo-hydrolase n=1 Tax=Gimibacter soli TaxID=3024400 RepID=A0AAE9XKJ5_9PROT|nr:MBL fold metallo-hydrolase [Gimibacter soli]WCL52632.1 MBL fold metallo-hydrolase [Gimibacter soli]